jgi:hypothetical protein
MMHEPWRHDHAGRILLLRLAEWHRSKPIGYNSAMKLQFSLATLLVCVTVLAAKFALATTMRVKRQLCVPSVSDVVQIGTIPTEDLAMKTILFAIVWTAASIAFAGWGQGDGDFDNRIDGGSDSPILLIHAVAIQKELDLSNQQKAAVKQTLVDLGHDLHEINQPIGNAGRGATTEIRFMQERMNEVEEPHRKRLNDLLTPDQRNRMQEIILQVEGARALGRKDIAAKLGLADDQKQKLKDIFEHTMNDKLSLGLRPSRGADNRQATEVLTTAQQEQFEKLKGKPVDFEPDKLGTMEHIHN